MAFMLNSIFSGQYRIKFSLKEKGKEPESTMETYLFYSVLFKLLE